MRASKNIIYYVFILLLPWFGVNTQSQDSSEVTLDSPKSGEVLQGQFSIIGSTMVEGFQTVELSFSYTDDPTGTWFLIYESDEPVVTGLITQWDTTTIMDGSYNLRLTVKRRRAPAVRVDVFGLRVRNYSTIETNTPTVPGNDIGTQSPIATSTNLLQLTTSTPSPTRPSDFLTITPLPENPIELNIRDVTDSASRGAAVVLTLFVLVGIYLSLRRLLRS
ncbi:MAG: hypothetical protein PVG32_05145 [Anaerolineales bacterium]|jgi:hypothetical protein